MLAGVASVAKSPMYWEVACGMAVTAVDTKD